MGKNTIRCGDSNRTVTEIPRLADGRRVPFVPKRKPMHFGSSLRAGRDFRVVARRSDGRVALVCLGESRERVVELAWAAWADGLPLVEALFIERWEVRDGAGGWSSVKAAKGELPEKPRLRRRNKMR